MAKARPRPAPRDPARPPPRGGPLPPGDDLGAADLARRVAVNLREKRKRRGMSLDQLAVGSGVSGAAPSQIEPCKSHPSLSVLWHIAVGLEILVSGLMGADGPAGTLLRRAERR